MLWSFFSWVHFAGSNAERGIQGDGLLAVFKTKVFGGELDGVCRVIGLDVEIQTLGLGVIRGLDLNGDQLAFPLDDKIHFCAALGLPVIGCLLYTSPSPRDTR